MKIISQVLNTLKKKRLIACSNLGCLYLCVLLHLQGLYITLHILTFETLILLFVHRVVRRWIWKFLLLIDSSTSWTWIVFELLLLSVPMWTMSLHYFDIQNLYQYFLFNFIVYHLSLHWAGYRNFSFGCFLCVFEHVKHFELFPFVPLIWTLILHIFVTWY